MLECNKSIKLIYNYGIMYFGNILKEECAKASSGKMSGMLISLMTMICMHGQTIFHDCNPCVCV